jgi:hypothetical protein
VDLNKLYFDHQIQLIRADGAANEEARAGYALAAAEIAGRIGQKQARLGAAAACAWMAHARKAAA